MYVVRKIRSIRVIDAACFGLVLGLAQGFFLLLIDGVFDLRLFDKVGKVDPSVYLLFLNPLFVGLSAGVCAIAFNLTASLTGGIRIEVEEVGAAAVSGPPAAAVAVQPRQRLPAPPPPADEWFIGGPEGEAKGPYSLGELTQMIGRGEVARSTRITHGDKTKAAELYIELDPLFFDQDQDDDEEDDGPADDQSR